MKNLRFRFWKRPRYFSVSQCRTRETQTLHGEYIAAIISTIGTYVGTAFEAAVGVLGVGLGSYGGTTLAYAVGYWFGYYGIMAAAMVGVSFISSLLTGKQGARSTLPTRGLMEYRRERE